MAKKEFSPKLTSGVLWENTIDDAASNIRLVTEAFAGKIKDYDKQLIIEAETYADFVKKFGDVRNNITNDTVKQNTILDDLRTEFESLFATTFDTDEQFLETFQTFLSKQTSAQSATVAEIRTNMKSALREIDSGSTDILIEAPDREISLDYINNTYPEFNNKVKNVFDVTSGKVVETGTNADFITFLPDAVDIIEKMEKTLKNDIAVQKDILEASIKANEAAQEDLTLSDAEREVKKQEFEAALEKYTSIQLAMDALREIAKSTSEKAKKMSAAATNSSDVRGITKLANRMQADSSAELDKLAKDSLGSFKIIGEGTKAFGYQLDAVGEAATKMGKTFDGIGGGMKSFDQASGMFGDFTDILKNGVISLAALGAAASLAGKALSMHFEQLDISRSMGDTSGKLGQDLQRMHIKTLMDPAQLKQLSESVSSNFNVSLTNNKKELERVATKQRLSERVMGKEYTEAQMEAINSMKNVLEGQSPSAMMDDLAAQTSALAKTMGVSNKYALEQIKAIHENTKIITKGLNKDIAKKLESKFHELASGLKEAGMSEEYITEMREAVTQAAADDGKAAEEKTNMQKVMEMDGEGSKFAKEAYATMGLDQKKALDLMVLKQNVGFEGLNETQKAQYLEVVQINRQSQEVEYEHYAKIANEQGTSTKAGIEAITKMKSMSDGTWSKNGEMADKIKASGGTKQYLDTQKRGEKEYAVRGAGESATASIDKLLVTMGATDVESRKAKLNELKKTVRPETADEKAKYAEGKKQLMLSQAESVGIDKKQADAMTPEALAKALQSKGVDVNQIDTDAWASAIGPRLEKAVKDMETTGKGEFGGVSGAKLKATVTSDNYDEKRNVANSTGLENTKDTIERASTSELYTAQNTIIGLVNDAFGILNTMIQFVIANLGILNAVLLATTAAYGMKKIIDGAKAVGGAFTSLVNSVLPAEKKFAGFSSMLSSVGTGLKDVVAKSFSLIPGKNVGRSVSLGGDSPDMSFIEKTKKSLKTLQTDIANGFNGLKDSARNGIKGLREKSIRNGFESLKDMAGKGFNSLKGLAGSMRGLIGPAAIVGAGLVAFEGALEGWGQATDIFVSEEAQKNGQVATLGQKFSSALGGAVSALTFGLVDIEDAAKGIYSAFTDFGGLMQKSGLTDSLSSVKDGFVSVFTDIKEKVTSFITFFAPLISSYKDTAIQVFGGIVGFIKGAFNIIKGIFTGDMSLISTGIQNIVGGWIDIVSFPLTIVEGILRTFFGDTIASAFGDTVDYMKTFFKETIGAVIDAIVTPFQPLVETVKNIVSEIKSYFGSLFKGIFALITGDWEGFKSNFSNMWDSFVNILKGIPTLIWDAVTGIYNAIMGVVDIIENGVLDLVDYVINIDYGAIFKSIGDGIMNAVISTVEWIQSININDIFSSIKNGLISSFTSLTDGIAGVVKSIKTSITESIMSLPGGETLLKTLGIDTKAAAANIKTKEDKEKVSSIASGAMGKDLLKKLESSKLSEDTEWGFGELHKISANAIKAMTDAQLKSLQGLDTVSNESKKVINSELTSRQAGGKRSTTIAGVKGYVNVAKDSLANVKMTAGANGKMKIDDYSSFSKKSKGEIRDYINNNRKTLDDATLKKLDTLKDTAKTERQLSIEKTTADRKAGGTIFGAKPGTVPPVGTKPGTVPPVGNGDLASLIGSSTTATTGKLSETNTILSQIRDNIAKGSTQTLNVKTLPAKKEGGSTGGQVGDSIQSAFDRMRIFAASPIEEPVATTGKNEYVVNAADGAILNKTFSNVNDFVSNVSKSKQPSSNVKPGIGRTSTKSIDRKQTGSGLPTRGAGNLVVETDEVSKKQMNNSNKILESNKLISIDNKKVMEYSKKISEDAYVLGQENKAVYEETRNLTAANNAVNQESKSLLSDGFSNITNKLGGMMGTFATWGKNAFSTVTSSVGGAFDFVTSGIGKAVDFVKDIASHIHKSETGKTTGNYSAAKDIGDGAGISFGSYQLTEKSGGVKEYITQMAKQGDQQAINFSSMFAKNGAYIGDKQKLQSYLQASGGTEKGKATQDKIYSEKYLQPAMKLAASKGITDKAAIAQIVDHAVNAGVGGASRMLKNAKGTSAIDVANARKQDYNAVIARDPSKAKFKKGWDARVDNNTKSFAKYAGTSINAKPILTAEKKKETPITNGQKPLIVVDNKKKVNKKTVVASNQSPIVNTLKESGKTTKAIEMKSGLPIDKKTSQNSILDTKTTPLLSANDTTTSILDVASNGVDLKTETPQIMANGVDIPTVAGTSGIENSGVNGVKSSTVINNTAGNKKVDNTKTVTNNTTNNNTTGEKKDPVLQRLEKIADGIYKTNTYLGQRVKQTDKQFKADANKQTVVNVKTMQGSKTIT